MSRFSTLYGSKWVATFLGGLRAAPRLAFQYPLRVEVGCNCFIMTDSDEAGESFSTLYGSKWVATHWEALASVLTAVSVPSTGRSGLQPVARL